MNIKIKNIVTLYFDSNRRTITNIKPKNFDIKKSADTFARIGTMFRIYTDENCIIVSCENINLWFIDYEEFIIFNHKEKWFKIEYDVLDVQEGVDGNE